MAVPQRRMTRTATATHNTNNNNDSNINDNTNKDNDKEADTRISQMTVREIKHELQRRQISFADCFDKESLVQRLQDARKKAYNDDDVATTAKDNVTTTASTTTTEPQSTASSASSSSASHQKTQETDSEATVDQRKGNNVNDKKDTSLLQQLQAMRVSELRQELAARNIRWRNMLEKRDLVQAVYDARQRAAAFSVTGLLTPGQVATLTGDQIQQEATTTTSTSLPPLVVDAYATWCGPCQMQSPQLEAAAAAWGDRIRVAKFDTDQNTAQASAWRIQGLPTLLLFHQGKLLARREGAVMKEELMQWVEAEWNKVKSST